MKKRTIIALLLVLVALPAIAVFKEENLLQTLTVLKGELQTSVDRIHNRGNSSQKRIEAQHRKLVNLVEESNQLSLMLYSQQRDFTLDLTFALSRATRQYEDFQKSRVPFQDILETMSDELERYDRLSQTLRNIPPVRSDSTVLPETITVLDSISVNFDTLLSLPSFAISDGFEMDSVTTAMRDSCLALSVNLAKYFYDQIKHIEEDSQHYADTDLLLKEAYDYAKTRYEDIQHKVFFGRSRSYFRILRTPARYFQTAIEDYKIKYSVTESLKNESFSSIWKGPVVWFFSFAMLIILALSILVAKIVVSILSKKVKAFNTTYFQEHRGMIITLLGTLLFAILQFIVGIGENTNFYTMGCRMMAEFTLLLATIFASMLIRMDKAQSHASAKAYLPTLLLAFFVIFLRIVFIPDSILILTLPLMVLIFTVWQVLVNLKTHSSVPSADATFLWISAAVMGIATVMSWAGWIMPSVLVLIWWFFQLMLIQVITALTVVLQRRHDNTISKRIAAYRADNAKIPLSKKRGALIEVTWLYDLVKMVAIPILWIWSVPMAISFACRVFNLAVAVNDIFFGPIINVEGWSHLSLFKLLLVVNLFFLFRYLVYAAKAFFRVWKTRSVVSKLGPEMLFKETDINFNLVNNIITLVGWGIYIIIVFRMLRIPTSALTIITTGLATGIGFALKDVLNNFFYGVQLMSGRVRVGDVIECDGIRGTVASLSYQSTQIEATDGSLIAFTNTALFNKNFKNLTRGNQYALVNFQVGVAYGTDVEKARKVILSAIEPLMTKDKYGHEVVDRKRGITVRLADMADSSVNLQVLLYATVDSQFAFAAKAKEAIYNAFNSNGIEIPFPQADIHIKNG